MTPLELIAWYRRQKDRWLAEGALVGEVRGLPPRADCDWRAWHRVKADA